MPSANRESPITLSGNSTPAPQSPSPQPIQTIEKSPAPKANSTPTPSLQPLQPLASLQPRKWFERRLTPARKPSLALTKPRTSTKNGTTSTWFQLKQRPYLTARDRDLIARGVRNPLLRSTELPLKQTVYHVDFTSEETTKIFQDLRKYPGLPAIPSDLEALARMCQHVPVPSLVSVPGRSEEDVRNFCSDVLAGKKTPFADNRVLSLQNTDRQKRVQHGQSSRISSLLFARELEGSAGFGRMRRLENFENEFRKSREDELSVTAEFTNCAGDISTISWVSNHEFVCGTTVHSDTHNQQYNKPGNLLLCSTRQGSLRAFPDHRIPRPVVEKGENSTEAMRQSQDAWLYSSVVSSDYDETHGRAYTSSFDKTVKVWKADESGMTALGTWQHEGNVNFVVVARYGSGLVATASDVPSEAVRIYSINEDNISESPYQAFSCSRTDAADTDKWAYYPATMQWGRAPGTEHLLVVGYSPRALSGDDSDIPEDKLKTGEITLWDAAKGCRLYLWTATTANVFEVVWHPTLKRFAVATTPCGNMIDSKARTQIHLFQLDKDRDDGGYVEFQSLDCMASDINELTFMANSVLHAYITAACTNGMVYVWDTAQGDKPIHALKHGYAVEEVSGDRESEDTGVKFTAWGTSLDRFYTGGSDGVVKVWNVRKGHKLLERVLLRAPGPISYGAFSPDHTKLAVGDATGRVFLLSVDKRDEIDSHYITVPGTNRRIRPPRPFIPHPEPPPPERDLDTHQMQLDEPKASEEGVYAGRAYLESQQLALTHNPVVGVVQGPAYMSTGLFRDEAHLDDDPAAPLLSQYDRQQRYSVHTSRGLRRRSVRRTGDPGAPDERLERAHEANKALDLCAKTLDRKIEALGLGDEALGTGVVEDLATAGARLRLERSYSWDTSDDEVSDG